jgi:hypothetical protein
MTDDPAEALERQVRQLTREVADLTRQVEHEQKRRGFVEDRLQRLDKPRQNRYWWRIPSETLST